MNTIDPKNKTAEDVGNDYDADSKIINQQNPVREGTGESSINSDKDAPADKTYTKLKENDNQPREQEEYIDDDKNNIRPEN